jgi:hypothetical protein
MFAQIDVLVAAASPDVQAEGIAAAVASRPDMTLAANRVLTITEAESLLHAMPRSSPCALVLVGVGRDDEEDVEQLSSTRDGFVVLRVDVIGDLVEIGVRDVGLDALLRALRELVGRSERPARERHSRVTLSAVSQGRGVRTIDRPGEVDR